MWILVMLVVGAALPGAHELSRFATEQECLETKKAVEAGMKAAYPDDGEFEYVCRPSDDEREKGEPLEKEGMET